MNFENDERAPLLFIAFESDHIVPPKASRHNAEKYHESEGDHGVQGVPRTPPLPGSARLGRGCRPRADLGEGERDVRQGRRAGGGTVSREEGGSSAAGRGVTRLPDQREDKKNVPTMKCCTDGRL